MKRLFVYLVAVGLLLLPTLAIAVDSSDEYAAVRSSDEYAVEDSSDDSAPKEMSVIVGFFLSTLTNRTTPMRILEWSSFHTIITWYLDILTPGTTRHTLLERDSAPINMLFTEIAISFSREVCILGLSTAMGTTRI